MKYIFLHYSLFVAVGVLSNSHERQKVDFLENPTGCWRYFDNAQYRKLQQQQVGSLATFLLYIFEPIFQKISDYFFNMIALDDELAIFVAAAGRTK